MIIDPARLKFETTNDYIDYVCRGPLPTRANFNTMKKSLEFAKDLQSSSTGELMNSHEDYMLYEVLDRIYADRVHNRRVTIGLVASFALVALFGVGISHHEKNDDDDERRRHTH